MQILESWRDFNVAMIGATATLAGLVIVAASVNITAIIKAVSLTARLAASIAGLLMALAASAIGLWPDLSLPALGIGVLLVGALSAVFQVAATARITAGPAGQGYGLRIANVVLAWAPTAAYLVGGTLLLVGLPNGLVLLALGSLLAITTAIVASWVALVEVLR